MISVIIPAGGTSSRYSKTSSKLDASINGTSILNHSIDRFTAFNDINEIIVPCHLDNIDQTIKDTSMFGNKIKIIPGGKTRAASVYNGFKKISKNCRYVLVHDAARPNVSESLIQRIIKSLDQHPVIIPGVSVTDTIKEVLKDTITKTIDRDNLIAVQTPQGFHYDVLKNAYNNIKDLSRVTDEAALVEMTKVFGTIIPGDLENIKLTHQIDLKLLSLLMTV
tara:strand:+ start:83 stop:748 length:666 start_codon:yes stop_codon:yes gene_type:complete